MMEDPIREIEALEPSPRFTGRQRVPSAATTTIRDALAMLGHRRTCDKSRFGICSCDRERVRERLKALAKELDHLAL